MKNGSRGGIFSHNPFEPVKIIYFAEGEGAAPEALTVVVVVVL